MAGSASACPVGLGDLQLEDGPSKVLPLCRVVPGASRYGVGDNQPTLSGGSSADKVMLEVAASSELVEAEVEVAGPHVNATSSAGAVPDVPDLDSESVANDSRDDDCAVDVPALKFRRLSCAEPGPSVPCGPSPELLAALKARGTTFLPTAGATAGGPAAAVEGFCRHTIATELTEDNFYVYNLATVERLYRAWGELLPRVHPCYAVKCNPDKGLLAVLAAMGAGFDCASEAEIQTVMALGVSPNRIVYAHPCKPPNQIRWAAAHGINLTTFDTESELHKMASLHSTSGLLLRIRADDPAARCQLGNKYGAELATVPHLLGMARDLGLSVRGVSFHVGSGARNPTAFVSAIEAARQVFDLALALGFNMDTLDLGGGFCGGDFDEAGQVDLGGVPAAINAALDEHFPDDGNLRVIAEPGRFFAEAFATLACFINGWRRRTERDAQEQLYDYFITDGLYGSMNCLVYDHAELAPQMLRSPLLPPVAAAEDCTLFKSTLYGPTCDGLDMVARDIPMPRLRNGDWVLFPKFGAYTVAGAVNFNGFGVDSASCKVHYIYC